MDYNWTYYDLLNPHQAFSKYLHSPFLDSNNLRYVYNIINTKLSMFKFDNLFDNYTNDIVNGAYLLKSKLCIYKSPMFGLGIYQYNPQNYIDINGLPTYVSLIGLNGEHCEDNVPYNDIILMKENPIDLPPIIPIIEYCQRMIDIDATIKAQLNQISLPLMFKGDKKQVNAFKQIANKAYSKEPFAIADNSTSLDNIEVFDIKLSVSPLDLYELKSKYKYELLNSLGIYSIEEKKERFLQGEVALKNDSVDFLYNALKVERETTIDLCNKKYGTNIKLVETRIEKQEDDFNRTMQQLEVQQQKQVIVSNNIQDKMED